MQVRLTVSPTGWTLASEVRWVDTGPGRMRGLLGLRSLDPQRGVVLPRARQVHTFGMRFPIDVVFCDEDWTVLHVVHAMKPWRVSRWVRGARYTVELAAGRAGGLSPGDRLLVTPS